MELHYISGYKEFQSIFSFSKNAKCKKLERNFQVGSNQNQATNSQREHKGKNYTKTTISITPTLQ